MPANKLIWHSSCREALARAAVFQTYARRRIYERSCSESHTRTYEDETNAARDVRPRQTPPWPVRSNSFCARGQQYAGYHANRGREVALLPTTVLASARYDHRRVAAHLADERSGR